MNKIDLDGTHFNVEKGQAILDAALEQGIDFPFNCQLGSCGRCKCKLLDGHIRHLGPFDYALEQDEIDNNMILACQSSVKTDVKISLSTD